MKDSGWRMRAGSAHSEMNDVLRTSIAVPSKGSVHVSGWLLLNLSPCDFLFQFADPNGNI